MSLFCRVAGLWSCVSVSSAVGLSFEVVLDEGVCAFSAVGLVPNQVPCTPAVSTANSHFVPVERTLNQQGGRRPERTGRLSQPAAAVSERGCVCVYVCVCVHTCTLPPLCMCVCLLKRQRGCVLYVSKQRVIVSATPLAVCSLLSHSSVQLADRR